jgi:predicted heme/steroid binding protein
MISGYGLTKGLIAQSLSQTLHVQLLPLIIIITFVLHIGLSLRMAFIRWQIWNQISKLFLILGCLLFLGFFVYVELFYERAPKIEEPVLTEETETDIDDATPEEEVEELEEDNLKVFTLKELSYYDGRNGRPAYVAVDGIVYDNTEIFKDGQHYSHAAGQELTEAFYSYHILEEITKYPVVGRLAE